MVRACLVTLCLLGGSLIQADDAVSLRHAPDYTQDKEFRTEVESETHQILTLAGMPLESKSTTFAVAKETVLDATKGAEKLAGDFEVFQITVNIPGGGEVAFDSGSSAAVPEGNGPIESMKRYFKVLSDMKWTSTLGPDGKVAKVEFEEGILDRVPDLFKSEMNSDRWKREANRDLDRLPENPVKVGESWIRDSEAELGSGQKFFLNKEYKYVGREERNGRPLDHVSIVTKRVKYEIGPNSTLPLTVKESDLKIESSKGDLWFDPERMRIVEIAETMHITGKLTLVINGNELPSELDLTMKIDSKVK